MAEEPLRAAVAAIGRRLQEELEAQLAALSEKQRQEIDDARRAAEAEAEERWTARVEAVRSEWSARLESEVESARVEAERRMIAEATRLRVEAEQAAAETAARTRQELEQTLTEERERAAAQADAERQQFSIDRDRLQQEIESASEQLRRLRQEIEGLSDARQRAEAALQHTESALQHTHAILRETQSRLDQTETTLQDTQNALRQTESTLHEERRSREEEKQRQDQSAAAMAEARLAERQEQLAIVGRLLAALRTMDGARSLSDVLSVLVASAAAEAPRVALFVVSGTELRGWKAVGFPETTASIRLDAGEGGLIGEVVRRAEVISTAAGAGPAAPAFAELPSDRAAIAVPLLVGAQPVAVIYADDGADERRESPSSWPEAIQILSRHASANLAHLTAARAADAMRRSLAPGARPYAGASSAGSVPPVEDGSSARRYARLLVSEIKLYNEPAVRMGRQHRDLLERLKPEIDRARRLYEQRISSSVDSRGALFQQELIQTLADGDPALLGGPV